MVFLTILLVPLLCTIFGFIISGIIKKQNKEVDSPYSYIGSFRDKEITWGEFGIQIVANLIVVAIFAGIISCQNDTYVEVWNGYVVDKKRNRVHCRHSYDCNCRRVCSGTGKNKTCWTKCDTCYEHRYDIDWIIYDNTGHTFDIDTQDSQGLVQPDFWNSAQKGDPTSHTHIYKNYIKAAPDSLFRKQGLVEKYKDVLPQYPNKIYNYYNLDRIVPVGVKIGHLDKLNKQLSVVNSKIGASKECNAIIVVVKEQPREYLYALEQHWVGGNKNDVILIISVTENGTIIWADVIALVQESIFKVNLRDGVEAVGTIKQMDTIIEKLHKIIMVSYNRKEMKDFKYLSSTVTPSVTEYVVAIIICTLLSISLSIYFHNEDVI
jgi:hypothetical protein